MQFAVSRNDFPAGITALKLKTIIIQVLDANRAGIVGLALEISKCSTALHLDRTTRADGFSEDLDTQIPVLPPNHTDVGSAYARPVYQSRSVERHQGAFFLDQFREA